MDITMQDNPETKVLAALEDSGLPFEVLECDPEFADTVSFCERYDVPLSISVNTIIMASNARPRRYAACVLLATNRLANSEVRRRLGVSKVSFAPPEEAIALTGMEPGGVGPFGLPHELPIFVDVAVLAQPVVVVGGGSRSRKVRVSPRALERLAFAEVIEGLAVPRP